MSVHMRQSSCEITSEIRQIKSEKEEERHKKMLKCNKLLTTILGLFIKTKRPDHENSRIKWQHGITP